VTVEPEHALLLSLLPLFIPALLLLAWIHQVYLRLRDELALQQLLV
jgi:hypothetical protein